ncbi:MAG: glycoside hydrolase family 95 protein [Oscillospiraceae bacterium]|nr:glycoside hydrolase family 95 protein [Oscillospiraceae bacterium]
MREYKIFDNIPTKVWEDSFPVGNGRMGATVMGYTDEEVLYLNEETVWSSAPAVTANPDMSEKLGIVRQLFVDGREAEGDKLAKEFLKDCFTRIRSYETAGQLKISLHENASCRNYSRTLDLVRGVAKIEYDKSGSHYTRECFTSHPDNVIAYRVTSSCAPINAEISYEREKTLSINTSKNELFAVCKTVFGEHKFCVRARVVTDGAVKCENGVISVSDTQSFTIYINITTEFRFGDQFEAAAVLPEGRSYEEILSRHVEDFSAIMSRAEICLPVVEELEDVSMHDRFRILKFNHSMDGGLIMLQWQFGRYILASSSRAGCLPANLQGLWVKGLGNEWSADYHTNINLQANYWPAEIANLSDCHTALFDYMNEYLFESGKETAKIGYKARGCVVHHLSDIYKFTTPADGLWGIWPHGASWLSYHMWEHYLFTKDKEFLKNEAYDFLREAAIFFVDTMVENKDGYLVYGPSTSPENRYWVKDENGENYACYLTLSSTMDVGIIGGLFRNFLDASKALGISDSTVAEIENAYKRLPPFKVSSSGRIQEWTEDYEETEKGHYHISHSFAHYPDTAIGKATPELREAIRKTIHGRIYGGNNPSGYSALNIGWSLGWIMGHLARLNEGNLLYDMVLNFLWNCSSPNLWDISAKCWQIDGNMSFVSGVCEALIQSHEGVISLIPALPDVWKDGSFRGLRARGGYELDIEWEDSEVVKINIRPDFAGEVTLELPTTQKHLSFRDNDGKAYSVADGKITLSINAPITLSAK